MMRLAWIILALAILAGGVVHLRRLQTNEQARLHQLEVERISVRRTLQDRQLRHDHMSGPRPAAWRAQTWPLEIVAPDGTAPTNEAFAQSEQ